MGAGRTTPLGVTRCSARCIDTSSSQAILDELAPRAGAAQIQQHGLPVPSGTVQATSQWYTSKADAVGASERTRGDSS